MQDLDNHSDDLFRNAAENYRPSPGANDWDKIAPLLTNNDSVNKKYDIRYKISAALLLIILFAGGGIIATYFSETNSNNNIKITDANNAKKSLVAAQQPENKIDEKNSKNNSSVTANVFTASASVKSISSVEKKEKLESNSLHPDSLTFENDAVKAPNLKPISPDLNEMVIATENSAVLSERNPEQNNNSDSREINVLENKTIAQPLAKVHPVTDSTAAVAKTSPSKTSLLKKNKMSSRQTGFYFGVLAGPEFSGVNTVRFDETGFEAGLVAGYQVTQKLAIETGLIVSKKIYACNGRYFKTDNISSAMPAGMQVLSVNGNCNVLELPLRLNYNIVNAGKGNVYVSAGVSSYVVTNEYNKYKTFYNGQNKDITGAYKKSASYFAATADIGIGFEKKLNNGNKIRLEPYVQFPLKGIGVGDLEVISTGIHVGYLLFPKK